MLVPIHLKCPNPPRLTVKFVIVSEMFSGQRANADFLAGGQRNKAHDRGEGANLAQDARVRS